MTALITIIRFRVYQREVPTRIILMLHIYIIGIRYPTTYIRVFTNSCKKLDYFSCVNLKKKSESNIEDELYFFILLHTCIISNDFFISTLIIWQLFSTFCFSRVANCKIPIDEIMKVCTYEEHWEQNKHFGEQEPSSISQRRRGGETFEHQSPFCNRGNNFEVFGVDWTQIMWINFIIWLPKVVQISKHNTPHSAKITKNV